MASKHEWDDVDRAATAVIAKLIKDSGVSYRGIEELTHSAISYSRVSDICTARRAPVKLSEFIAIVSALGLDPIKTTKQVLDTAAKEKRDNRTSTNVADDANAALADADNGIDIDAWADRIKAEDSVRDAE